MVVMVKVSAAARVVVAMVAKGNMQKVEKDMPKKAMQKRGMRKTKK